MKTRNMRSLAVLLFFVLFKVSSCMSTEGIAKSKTREKQDQIMNSTEPEIVYEDIFECDAEKDTMSRKSNGGHGLWPNKVLRFRFDDKADAKEKSVILDAMKILKRKTCIRFKEVEDSVTHRVVVITKGEGCFSAVGMIGFSGQTLSMSEKCSQVGSALHEIGHALGLHHEQCRSDRDKYVKVRRSVIRDPDSNEVNYKLHNTKNYGVPYDYYSIMHYTYNVLSKEPYEENWLVTKNIAYTYKIGIGGTLSFLDAKILNLMYKCNENCKPKDCGKDGGYVGPNCNCVCPDGLSGENCETGQLENELTCGKVVKMTKMGERVQITTPNYPRRTKYEYCAWDIFSPKGTSVYIHFHDFDFPSREEFKNLRLHCYDQWVELRTENLYAGSFFCADHLLDFKGVSKRNRMRIIINPMKSSAGRGFNATVSVVPRDTKIVDSKLVL